MTVMFEDVHSRINPKPEIRRVPGTKFDEVGYADDAICFSTNSSKIEEGVRYGLKLNKHNRESITTHQNANIHFGDSTKVFKTRLATYLGCTL